MCIIFVCLIFAIAHAIRKYFNNEYFVIYGIAGSLCCRNAITKVSKCKVSSLQEYFCTLFYVAGTKQSTCILIKGDVLIFRGTLMCDSCR